jgi:3-oxoadipate enol-lactonase
MPGSGAMIRLLWRAGAQPTGREKFVIDRIHREVAGSGAPVVFTHDGLIHSEGWTEQFGVFSQKHRVTVWDRRGYGRSPRSTVAFSSVDDLSALVRWVSDSPATLVGGSFGAFFSLQCTLENPHLVAGLVLVGPVVHGLPFSEHFLTRGGRLPPADAPVEDLVAYWSERDPWFVAPQNTDARQRLRALLTANPHNFRPGMELERQPDPPTVTRLGEIAVPTLIVVGEQDIADVHAHAGAIEAAIPGARRVVLRGSGHLAYLEVSKEFNQVVLDFLAGLGTH